MKRLNANMLRSLWQKIGSKKKTIRANSAIATSSIFSDKLIDRLNFNASIQTIANCDRIVR